MSCSLGIQKTVEKILGNKPWFNYNQVESYIEISESPNKKINPSNFFSVAQTVSQAINKQINKGDKRIGDISYPTYINNSPVVKIAPTKAQLDLLNTEDQQEILELEKEIAQEKQQEEFNQLEKESNSINVEGEVQPIFFQLNKNTNEVAYALKAMDILQSPKGDEVFRKGDKNNWTIDKILQELQVPKEQQELIKSFNTRNREEILTSLLANYSYAIEINTVKEPSNVQKSGYWNNNEDYISGTNEIVRDFDDRDIDDDSRNYWFTDRYGNIYSRDKNKYFKNQKEIRESLWEAEKNSINRQLRAKELNLTNPKPTQYYSNLTVPGGTNYTENEIATPAITPSIKGHAAFSTNSGIGWFRTDDKQSYIEQDVDALINNMIKSGVLQKNCS